MSLGWLSKEFEELLKAKNIQCLEFQNRIYKEHLILKGNVKKCSKYVSQLFLRNVTELFLKMFHKRYSKVFLKCS